MLKSSLSVGMLAELLGPFVSFVILLLLHTLGRIYQQDFEILLDQNASLHPADSRLVSLRSDSADGPLVSGSARPERCAGLS